jgi:hypothetical protein
MKVNNPYLPCLTDWQCLSMYIEVKFEDLNFVQFENPAFMQFENLSIVEFDGTE